MALDAQVQAAGLAVGVGAGFERHDADRLVEATADKVVFAEERGERNKVGEVLLSWGSGPAGQVQAAMLICVRAPHEQLADDFHRW